MPEYPNFVDWCEMFVKLRNPLNGEIENVKFSGELVPWKRLPDDIREKYQFKKEYKKRKGVVWQKLILDEAIQFDEEGLSKYETILYSCPKKSGKTAVNSLLMAYWAFNVEAPNEIITVANKRDQAIARGYREMSEFIKRNAMLENQVVGQSGTKITLANGTTILAIPNDFSGEAGSNHGMTSWDELWGFTTERDLRLWDELTPVPTRLNSIRFISTYAGFTGESTLLEQLYYKIFDPQHKVLPHVQRPLGDSVPVFTIPEERLFVYWDNQGRMPWQTEKYYASQKVGLRESAYLRLHENLWVSSETGLFDMKKWDACVSGDHSPPIPDKFITLYVGVDIGVKRDRSAVVTVYRDSSGKLKLGPKRFWSPTAADPIDLEETVEAYVEELAKGYNISVVRYDPYQFHRSAMTLAKMGINMQEYPQTTANLQIMGQNIYDLVEYKNLVLYEDVDLRFEANCARAKESMRGLQITKEKSTQKIDQIVALAMAAVDTRSGYFANCDTSAIPRSPRR
jgi:phage terminase large subunit-like protein